MAETATTTMRRGAFTASDLSVHPRVGVVDYRLGHGHRATGSPWTERGVPAGEVAASAAEGSGTVTTSGPTGIRLTA
jgi:hypothetical protein